MVFDADVRYSGVSIGYTPSQVIGSAFAPTVATALYSATGSSTSIAAYLVAASAISVVSVILLPGGWGRDGARRQLDDDRRANTIATSSARSATVSAQLARTEK